MKTSIVSVCLLVAGLAGGYFLAKRTSGEKRRGVDGPEIEVRYSDVGDPFMVVQRNDNISFRSRNGGQNVVFKDLAPCEDKNLKRKTCKIGPSRGLYFYECSGCPDPGIAVGSTSLAASGKAPDNAQSRDFQNLSYATPKSVKIVCTGQVGNGPGTPILNLPTTSGITAAKNDVFEFYPVGDFDFSIDMRINGDVLCQELSISQYNLSNNNPTCTLKDDPPSGGKDFFPLVTNCGSSPTTLKFNVHP